ncbi:MAG: hypothetical protein N4A35_05310 [Flavobacteriales bacterium]|jgi:hypothetical protein|nr:hypothetical protein [Flavobacteriales bacterium]
MPIPQTTIVNYYTDKDDSFQITYINGYLLSINLYTADMIDWDGLKHGIPFYEEDINLELFHKQK